MTHREYLERRKQINIKQDIEIQNLLESAPKYIVTLIKFSFYENILESFIALANHPDVNVNSNHLLDLKVGEYYTGKNISYVRIK